MYKIVLTMILTAFIGPAIHDSHSKLGSTKKAQYTNLLPNPTIRVAYYAYKENY